MPEYTITDFEDAILAALEPLKATHGVQTLESYDLHLEDPEVWKKLAIKFPAIFVLFGSMDTKDNGQRQMESNSFQIGMADRSLRKGEARRGGAQVGGAYGLIDGVRKALAGKILLPDMTPIMPRSVRQVVIADGVAMYAATYTIGQGYLIP
jgi:hypothetical protein